MMLLAHTKRHGPSKRKKKLDFVWIDIKSGKLLVKKNEGKTYHIEHEVDLEMFA